MAYRLEKFSMRYIDTINQCEHLVHTPGDPIPNGVIAADDSHAFFQELPLNHRIIWNGEGVLPTVEAIPQAELDAMQEIQDKAEIVQAVQDHMDASAQALGYDSVASAVTYADEPSVTKFQDEGQAYRAWRSQVWNHCYGILADYEAGNIAKPTPQEVIDGLPALNIVYS